MENFNFFEMDRFFQNHKIYVLACRLQIRPCTIVRSFWLFNQTYNEFNLFLTDSKGLSLYSVPVAISCVQGTIHFQSQPQNIIECYIGGHAKISIKIIIIYLYDIWYSIYEHVTHTNSSIRYLHRPNSKLNLKPIIICYASI